VRDVNRAAWLRSLPERALGALRSTRFAIALLILIGLTAAIGGVLPQTPTIPNADLIYESYGPFWHSVIGALALDDVFHSAGFSALLALFALNLVLCTAGRVPRVVRAILRPAPPEEGTRNAVDLTVEVGEKSASEIDGATRRTLRKRRLRARKVGGWLVAERCRWSRLGADLVHASILVILVGAFLGVYQVDGYFAANETELGKTIPFRLPSAGGTFSVRVDGFGAELHPGTLSVKDYWTRLSVIENGVLAASLETRVNRRATYRGISFYQTTYGDDLDAARVVLAAIDRPVGVVVGSVSLRVGQTAVLSATGLEVRLVRFFTHLRRTATGSLINAPGSGVPNPAALIDVRPLDGGAAFQVVAFPNASPHDDLQSAYALLLSAYEVPKAVGIRYARNPGYPVVWAGLVLMMAGLTVAFYLPARRLWILVEPRDGRIILLVEPSRGAERGTAWAESIRRAIEEELKGGW